MMQQWAIDRVKSDVTAWEAEAVKLTAQAKRLRTKALKTRLCQHTEIVHAGAYVLCIDRCAKCGYEWYF